MRQYSKELKLEIINRYLMGESAFDESSTNKSYSKELKEKVIKDYLDDKGSLEDLVNKYNISTHEIVRSWVLKYNSGIEIKDYTPNGDVYTMKSRSTTLQERLEIANYALSNNNDYKGAADKYTVPYAMGKKI